MQYINGARVLSKRGMKKSKRTTNHQRYETEDKAKISRVAISEIREYDHKQVRGKSLA